MNLTFLFVMCLIISVGFWLEMKYIMRLGNKEILITLVFTNLLILFAVIFQKEIIAYIILGVGGICSILYSIFKDEEEK